MQKKIMIGLSFIAQFLGLQLFAQQHPVANTNKKVASEKSLLWKVSGKDLKKPSYIFGTMHAICSDDYFFTEPMTVAFESTSQLVLEVDLSKVSAENDFQADMLLPKGKTLLDFFESPEQFNEFALKLRNQTDIDIELFKAFKPFVLISAMSMKELVCPTNTASYELNLMEMAQQKGITMTGLETASSQLEIFDNMKDSEIRNLLLESVNDGMKNENEHQLIETYKQQDLEGLYAMMSQSMEIKGHEKELLINRNTNWVKQLPSMMKAQSSFVAVGAAHLPGQFGVLNLLRVAGYTVEAVK